MSTDALAIHCRQVIAQHSKSFALASRLLPPRARDRAAAVYAFCRRADDAIDLSEPEERPAAIARLFAELTDVYDGKVLTDPALAAFQRVVLEDGVPVEYPRELLAGMQMDVEGARYEALPDLLVYCFRVAGTVGLMMCHVLGVRDARALRHAAHLGIAMQLTNICRDVEEDWRNGRLYLPSATLRRAGAPELSRHLGSEPPLSARVEVATAVRALLGEADRFYLSGDRGLFSLSFRAALAVRAARLVYSAIGDELAARGHDVFLGRASVSGWRKGLLLLRAFLGALTELPARARSSFSPVPLPDPIQFPNDVLPI